MGFLHNAAAALKFATFSPEATEINDYVVDAHKEAKTEQVNFAADIITDTTHNKILSVADFQNPAKNEALGSPPSIKEIIAAAKDLKGEALVNYIETNGITVEYLREKMNEQEKEYIRYDVAWMERQREINRINNGHSDDRQIDKDTDSEMVSLDKSRNFHEEQRRLLAVIIKAYTTQKNIPKIAAAAKKTAENFAENGKTLEEIEKGSDLDKALKALGMELFEKENYLGTMDVYVSIDGKKVKVVNRLGFDEYKILLRTDKGERIITFKMVSGTGEDDAGAIYYTEFRENSKEKQVELLGKQPTQTDFHHRKFMNLKPIINTTTGNKTVAINK